VRSEVRTLGRRLFPSWTADRAIAYQRGLRVERGVPEVAVKVSTRLGNAVVAGPFRGMRLVPGFEAAINSPVLKLLGLYEPQLHSSIEDMIAECPKTIANVGSADGYYAVGLALRLPEAVVHAYDLASTARRMTRQLAVLNAVSERVVVHGRCRHFPEGVELVVCDIEGGEGDLLSTARAHDFAVTGVTEELIGRFSPTHDVEVVRETEMLSVHGLDPLSAEERAVALDDMRPADQVWLVFCPRYSIGIPGHAPSLERPPLGER
jgi:hypothetical protein